MWVGGLFAYDIYVCALFFVFFFFFSSRRRHTRCSRDWSSDVCSSDLPGRARPFPGGSRGPGSRRSPPARPPGRARSEEHTSELQSRLHLVCRLLLEKKNHTYGTTMDAPKTSHCETINTTLKLSTFIKA